MTETTQFKTREFNYFTVKSWQNEDMLGVSIILRHSLVPVAVLNPRGARRGVNTWILAHTIKGNWR